MLIIPLFIVIVVWVIWSLQKDYQKGLGLCAALLVAVPGYLRISFGGGLPDLTVHRMIIIILFIFWRRQPLARSSSLPLFKGLVALGITQLISMVFSIAPGGSFKTILSFALEIVPLYCIASTSLVNRDQILQLLRKLVVALSIVAILAVIERRWAYNISRAILLGSDAAISLEDITSTFSHRILLGYAMAMIVPIVLALKDSGEPGQKNWVLWVQLTLAIVGCYFSNSRGPWSGLVLGIVPIALLGSRRTKMTLLTCAVLAVIATISRPGIRETISSAVTSTFEQDSLKGKSYEYRWILWTAAYKEIVKSPIRYLFGYGGLSTESMDLGGYFGSESGGTTALLGYTSWDNQFACDLIEYGTLGLLIEAIVFIGILLSLFCAWLRTNPTDRTILAAVISSALIFVYAMTNVYIFSPQLKYLFWLLVAAGLQLGRISKATRASQSPSLPSRPL